MSEPMRKIVECACGYRVIDEEDEVVRRVQHHAVEAHQMEMSRDEVLAIARPADEDGGGRVPS